MPTPKHVCTVVGDRRIRPEAATGSQRVLSFDEAEPTLTAEQAMQEARRCTASSPCTYCDVCQLMCPDLCITRDGETGHIIVDLSFCKGCGLCAHYCPRGAITMIVDE